MSTHESASLPTHPSTDSRASAPTVSALTFDRLLLRAVDAGLIASLFAVPLVMGGRIAWGQLVLVVFSLWVGVCWCARQCLRRQAGWVRTPAGVLILAALGLVGLQLVCLPPSLLDVFSPRLHEALWLWAPDAQAAGPLGAWSTVSMTPAATRDALVLLLAFALLFLTTAQRVQAVEDAQRLIRSIALATVVMAVFALVQYVTNNGKLYWFFAHPSWHEAVNVQGSFSNRNHFAQFIALGIGPLVWWVHEGLRNRPRKHPTRRQPWAKKSSRFGTAAGLRVIALGFCVFVGLLSLSRGGAMAMFVAGIVCLAILHRGALVSRKTALGAIGAGLLVAACLQVFGYERVADRLNDFESVEKLDGLHERRQLWQADAAAVADYPLLGTGLGSHREVCPMYVHNEYTAGGFEYSHAENGYLQVAMETGLPGLALALGAVGLCLYWCLDSFRRNSSMPVLLCLAAVAPALAANFAHSLVDFVWYVPGCMIVVVILAACACRLRNISGDRSGQPAVATPIPRPVWIAAALCLAAIGCGMVRNRLAAVEAEPSWHRYLSLSREFNDTDEAEHRHSLLCRMAEELSVVVDRQPDHARAHIRLAEVRVKLFDDAGDCEAGSLDVRQVREAVLASRFESYDAMHDWLRRAFGGRGEHLDAAWKHARRGLALCPLQGSGYLYLANLSFLEGPHSPGKTDYVKQAVTARPFDGAVLFAAGQEAFLAGDSQAGLEYWRASYRAGSDRQEILLQHLAAKTPAEVFLEMFPSDLDALKLVLKHYRQLERPDDLRFVLSRYTAACEAEASTLPRQTAARCWAEAAGAYRAVGDMETALECLRKAVGYDANDFHARRAMGLCLYKLEQFEEAQQHLTWCLRRKPGDRQLRSQVEAALNGRLRTSSRSAPERK